MHLIFCVDERDGLSFCGRRLSLDREVYAHILRLCDGYSLWTTLDSASLFPEGTVHADEDFLQKAADGDYCFVETLPANEVFQRAESVILYQWNRRYPSTEKFPRAILSGMRMHQREDFPGNSHELITMERYMP